VDRGDLEREQDIEELRRIALAQQAQIAQLMEVLSRKSREIDKLRGKPGDMQLTLKMLAELQAKAKQTQAALAKASAKPKPKPRTSSGPTPQPLLPVVERVFELDRATARARVAAAPCSR